MVVEPAKIDLMINAILPHMCWLLMIADRCRGINANLVQ